MVLSLGPLVAVDKEASEAVIRRLVEACVVLLPVVNVRKLLRRAVLTPGDSDVSIEDQGSVSLPVANQTLLVGAVTLGALALLGARRMEPGAPATVPPPLCFSARWTKASQVAASSGWIAYSLMAPSFAGSDHLTDEGSVDPLSSRAHRPAPCRRLAPARPRVSPATA
jgi:hypothetical protein